MEENLSRPDAQEERPAKQEGQAEGPQARPTVDETPENLDPLAPEPQKIEPIAAVPVNELPPQPAPVTAATPAAPAPEDKGRSSQRTIMWLVVALVAVGALLCLVIGFSAGQMFGDRITGATPTALPPATAAPTSTPVPTPQPGEPPQAVIAAPNQAAVGEVIVFDGSHSTASSPIVSYAWDFGDGTQAGGSSVSRAYEKAGRYVITLTVTDQNGLSDSASLRIQIDEPTPTPEPPKAEIRGPTEAEVGETVTFDGRGSQSANPIVNYAWDFGDGTQGNGNKVNHIYGRGGTYVVTLTVTDNAGRTSVATTEIAIRDIPLTPPRAVIEAPSQAAVGENVTFSGANSQPGSSDVVRYAWDFGNGKTQEGRQETATIRYDDPGQYQVALTVSDRNNLGSTATTQIVIHAALEGTTWHLTTVLPGTDITAQFQRGQVSGSSGCNSYSGTYTTTASSPTSGALAISALSGAQRSCAEDVMALEARYREAFQSATHYAIQGNTLTISYLGGVLSFSDKPVATAY